jgi:hypothetical protein
VVDAEQRQLEIGVDAAGPLQAIDGEHDGVLPGGGSWPVGSL